MTAGVDVPKPPGIGALPTDHRGVVIAAHVPRRGGVPRITDVDPDRLLVLATAGHCTLCAWTFKADEQFWYIVWPNEVKLIEGSGRTHWGISTEGAAHEECLLYAAIVCPFLTTPGYVRHTDQRAGRVVVHERGSARPAPTLAGAPEMKVQLSSDPSAPFDVWIGGGPHTLCRYTQGSELLPILQERANSRGRTPTYADLELAQLMAEGSDAEIKVRAKQAWMVVAAREGHPRPPLGRNEPCSCGAAAKFKNCCLRRYELETVRQRASP